MFIYFIIYLLSKVLKIPIIITASGYGQGADLLALFRGPVHTT